MVKLLKKKHTKGFSSLATVPKAAVVFGGLPWGSLECLLPRHEWTGLCGLVIMEKGHKVIGPQAEDPGLNFSSTTRCINRHEPRLGCSVVHTPSVQAQPQPPNSLHIKHFSLLI